MRILCTSIIVAMICLFGVGTASAKEKANCEMTGEWLDGTKVTGTFVFTADYTIRRGADEFTGRYLNPTNKAQADVSGVQTDGNWLITMKYTGEVNKGQSLKAIGEGLFKGTAITITGTYKRTDAGGKSLQEGKFKMTGNCKLVH